jgi:hypothetical protein
MPSPHVRSVFLGLPVLLGVGVSVMVACSGGSTTTGGKSVPESHAAVQTNGACTTKADVLRGTAGVGAACQTYADCAPVCCACSQSTESFSAAACVEGVCASRDATCSLSKKVDYCPGDPAPTDAGPSVDGSDPLVDGALPPPATTTTMCIAFTGSHASDREAARLAALQQLITQVTTSPGGGTLNVVRDSANRPTSANFSASGSAEDYHVTITYDAAGNVTQLHRTWSGATQTDTHAFSYDTQNHLTSAKVTWSGAKPTENESLTYDSSLRLSTWKQTWSDAQPTENETLTYDSDGFLATWKRTWSDAQPTENETFTYDASQRLTTWKRSWSDATPTETATFSYSGSTRTPASSNLSGPIPMGSHVVDCK